MDIKTFLSGGILLILILTAFLTTLISLLLLYQYRRSVIQLMSKYAPQISHETPQKNRDKVLAKNPFPLEFIHINDNLKEDIKIRGKPLYRRLARSSWRSVLIYSLAGLGYAVVMSLSFLLSSQIEFSPLRFLTLILLYIFPTLLTIYLVAIPDRKIRLIIPIAYVLVYFFLVILPNWSLGISLLLPLFTFNFFPSLLIIAFLNRRTRAVAPLITAFIFFAVTGVFLSLAYGMESIIQALKYSNSGIFSIFIFITGGISSSAFLPASLALLTLSGMLVMGIFGVLLLTWVKRQYRHKKISDQSLLIDAVWIVFALYQSVAMVFKTSRWFFSGLVALLVFKIITKIGFFITKKKVASGDPPQLLFLRVFSLGVESQKLYRDITAYWRHAGSTLFITGPDLVASTVEPHDFLDYLVKKLPERFIDSKETLDKQISKMDMEPDADGLYRIHDYFCYANTWKMALARLTQESEVVLMDLRSFSAQNAGCAFEIDALINTVRLEQIVFLIDKTTDKRYMHEIMTTAWEKMKPSSPNKSSAGKLRLFEYTKKKSGETQKILQAIAISVSPA